MRFSDILGHERVIDALRQAHHGDTVHHAYLFAGPDGVGKRRVAVAFAAMVNCVGDAPTDAEGRRLDGCGTCKLCRRILGMLDGEGDERRTHPDVMLLEPDGRQIKIAQVRETIKVVPFPPIEARYRFILVDPADALGDEAANALLKTLEEPSSRTRFILVSARPDSLLTTIRSRCQRVHFGRLADDVMHRALVERHGVGDTEAQAATSLADGSLGAAIALVEDPILAGRAALIRRILGVAPGDVLEAFALAADLADSREAIPTVLEVLGRLYRDLLLVRTGAADTVALSNPDLRDELEAAAGRYGVEALMTRLDLIADTHHGLYERNLNARASIERLVLALTAAAGDEATFVDARALTEAGR